jgi:predicted GIY-YIG superfamily endonuclease
MSEYEVAVNNPYSAELLADVSKLPSRERGCGYVYLLESERPIGSENPRGQASHYLGSTVDVQIRYMRHLRGRGGRVPNVWNHKGIRFHVVWVQKLDSITEAREMESRLKKTHKNWHAICPNCQRARRERRRLAQKARRAAERAAR